MRSGKTIVELAQEIQRQAETKKDYVADTRALEMVPVLKPELLAPEDEDGEEARPYAGVALKWGNNGDTETQRLQRHASRQLADRFKVPSRTYDRLETQHPDLLAHLMSGLMHREPQKRMIRTLDGEVRAFLSDRYRPLDNADLFEAAFPVLKDLGVEIVSCEVTQAKLYIKFIAPGLRRQVPDLVPDGYASGRVSQDQYGGRDAGPTGGFSASGWRKDEIVAGGVISNSEVGSGTLHIADLDFQCWCLNGMIRAKVVRQTHVGRSAGFDGLEDASEFFRDETRRLDDAALFSKMRDTLAAMFRAERFEARIDSLRAAKADVIEDATIVPSVVEVVGKRLALPESTSKGVLASLIESGDLSRGGVANALTRIAQSSEIGYDDCTDLEVMGGKLVELPKNDWSKILREAEKLAA